MRASVRKIDPIPNIYRINIFYREKIWLFYFRVEIFIRIIDSLQEQHYIENIIFWSYKSDFYSTCTI
ncbi:unnamed protein product [Rhizophagus irregularis]|uniref:Uncharacterized protein n=1 Tax=Rhizophagus irregularis TaxID=588596 RepID=A0A915Z2K0_9GLOM|nr:unnamed protein product [Rhizophagus irregularis]